MTRLLATGLLAIGLSVHGTVGLAATAQQNYDFYCVSCHGANGNGKGINETAGGLTVSPRDHTNAEQMGKLSDEDLFKAIARGGDAVAKSELMPPWDQVLTESEIVDLVKYLRGVCKCSHTPSAPQGKP